MKDLPRVTQLDCSTSSRTIEGFLFGPPQPPSHPGWLAPPSSSRKLGLLSAHPSSLQQGSWPPLHVNTSPSRQRDFGDSGCPVVWGPSSHVTVQPLPCCEPLGTAVQQGCLGDGPPASRPSSVPA